MEFDFDVADARRRAEAEEAEIDPHVRRVGDKIRTLSIYYQQFHSPSL